MKLIIQIFCFFVCWNVSTQQIETQKIQSEASNITIQTQGLDQIILESTDVPFIEVILKADEYDDQHIRVKHNDDEVIIGFEFLGFETREVIFRKFITKRLQRATAIVKIPRKREVRIYGTDVDIESKSIKNVLDIFIDNGLIKLNTINANTLVQLYSGNVSASISQTDITIKSLHGKIALDGNVYKSELRRLAKTNGKSLSVNSIRANVFLRNQ